MANIVKNRRHKDRWLNPKLKKEFRTVLLHDEKFVRKIFSQIEQHNLSRLSRVQYKPNKVEGKYVEVPVGRKS